MYQDVAEDLIKVGEVGCGHCHLSYARSDHDDFLLRLRLPLHHDYHHHNHHRYHDDNDVNSCHFLLSALCSLLFVSLLRSPTTARTYSYSKAGFTSQLLCHTDKGNGVVTVISCVKQQ